MTLDGKVIFDSGSDFERIIASEFPDSFNANHFDDEFDKRSDNGGIEPEGIIVEKLGTKQFAFIGLERMGGIMVYDVTEPFDPEFVEYASNRDFSSNSTKLSRQGDLGPEGILFIPRHHSPINNPLLVVANEISGTTSIYKIVSDK